MITYNPNALLQVFGENITYQYKQGEDTQISAIVSIGETNKTGNGLNTIGTSSTATIDVAVADVPNPSVMDHFVIRGGAWKFVRILSTDGIMQKIQISKDTRHK